jgi:hypothetical protein
MMKATTAIAVPTPIPIIALSLRASLSLECSIGPRVPDTVELEVEVEGVS